MATEMDATILVLVALVALGSVVQTLSLIGLGRVVVSTSQRLADVGTRVLERLRPTVAELARASNQAAHSSGVLARESARLGDVLEEAAVRVERAQDQLAGIIVPTASRAASIMAAAKLVRSGLRFYRRFLR